MQVTPLIFRMPYGNRPFYIGDVAPTITTSQYENNNFIMEFTPPPRIGFLNATAEGLAPSITAHYLKANAKNLLEYTNGHRDIAVIEFYEQRTETNSNRQLLRD